MTLEVVVTEAGYHVGGVAFGRVPHVATATSRVVANFAVDIITNWTVHMDACHTAVSESAVLLVWP